MNKQKEKRYREAFSFYNNQTGTETEKRAKTLLKTGYSLELIKKINKHFENENSTAIPASN